MARPRKAIPALKFHKQTRQWFYFRQGKRHYLGREKAEAERRFKAAISRGPQDEPIVDSSDCILSEALNAYWQFAKTHYTDKRARDRISRILAVAHEVQGGCAVDEFRPSHFRAIRGKLLESPSLSRNYINALMKCLKTAFVWLAAEHIIPAGMLAAAQTIKSLAPGEGGRETDDVEAVEDWVIDATIPECHPTLAAMIQAQRLTGCRPGELCHMRREEISTSPAELIRVHGLKRKIAAMPVEGAIIWLYAPDRHKNKWRGKVRIIPIGPDAQQILKPFFQPSGYVFRPSDVLSEAECRALGVGPHYTVRAYRNAIGRAVERANAFRGQVAVKLATELPLLPPWAPNQLRHAALEDVAEREDAEAAGIMAGHGASRRALDAYVRATIKRAAATAAKCG